MSRYYGSIAYRHRHRRAAANIAAGRSWIAECSWSNLTEAEDFAELTGEQVHQAVERHYQGGWLQFVKDHGGES